MCGSGPETGRMDETNVSFPNSMVDRITPATTAQDIARLNNQSGIYDKAPVYCEDFIQWVIEDNFIAGRPAWERVGVEFTDDYHILNVPPPTGIDLKEYKQTLIERFANPAVSDQISRLCFDGISKFPVYIMPNLLNMIKDNQELSRVAFLIASYRHYLKYQTDDKQQQFEIAEPLADCRKTGSVNSNNPVIFSGYPHSAVTEPPAVASFVEILYFRILAHSIGKKDQFGNDEIIVSKGSKGALYACKDDFYLYPTVNCRSKGHGWKRGFFLAGFIQETGNTGTSPPISCIKAVILKAHLLLHTKALVLNTH
ncbi:hypothetical protein FQR65_LT17744 [Abscondita terminalis]|nr:hypothetical protein FQR65_LT17744 [Abscondita terminalis]